MKITLSEGQLGSKDQDIILGDFAGLENEFDPDNFDYVMQFATYERKFEGDDQEERKIPYYYREFEYESFRNEVEDMNKNYHNLS